MGIGFLYHVYAPSASCSLNIWFITSIILCFLAYGAISVSPLRTESAGLFTSACVLAYTSERRGCAFRVLCGVPCASAADACAPSAPADGSHPLTHSPARLLSPRPPPRHAAYYCWSALNSEPLSAECAVSSTGANKTVQIIALVIALVAVRSSLLVGCPFGALALCTPCLSSAWLSPLGLLPASLQLGFSTLSAGTSSKAFDLSTGEAADDEASARISCPLPGPVCLPACPPCCSTRPPLLTLAFRCDAMSFAAAAPPRLLPLHLRAGLVLPGEASLH